MIWLMKQDRLTVWTRRHVRHLATTFTTSYVKRNLKGANRKHNYRLNL